MAADYLHELWQHVPAGIKVVVDLISLTALLGYLVQALPILSTSLTVVWMTIRILETDTVQGWLKRRRNRTP